MSNEIASTFVQPYSQIALNGEFGLTSIDVAKSLGVDIEGVHRKIKRAKWTKNENWKPIPYVILNENNGLDNTYYVFTIDGAKAFVARWVNNLGDGYLEYLFFLESQLPKVLAQNKLLQKENDLLKKQSTKKLKRKNSVVVKTPIMVTTRDMFGSVHDEIRYVEKKYALMHDKEKKDYLIKHIPSVMSGLSEKLKELVKDTAIFSTFKDDQKRLQ